MSNFVPKYLGLSHIDISKVSERTHNARMLCADPKTDDTIAVNIHRKSGGYSLQRWSYFVHKGRQLLRKCCMRQTTGYILTGLGPFLDDGKNSDEKKTLNTC